MDNILIKERVLIDQGLKKFLPKDNSSLSKAMCYSMFAGGKRFRPILMLIVCRMLGGKIKDILPAACAVEMIHTFTLIHDDLPVMDNSDLRRGKPTCHKKFGEDIALLAGDALNTLAFKVIADNVPKEKAAKVISELSSVLLEVVDGQRMDLEGEDDMSNKGPNAHSSLYLKIKKIHFKKTAALIIGSVRIAGILSGAKEKELKALTIYAREMGLAFQIADDILDVTSSVLVIGKPTQADQKNKKNTYPLIFGLKKSRELAQLHVSQAKKALNIFGRKAKILNEIADFAIGRLT